MSFRRALLDTFTKSIGVERLIQSLGRIFFEKEYEINGIRFKVSMNQPNGKMEVGPTRIAEQ